MPQGARSTAQLVTLTGWDAGALESYRLQDGTTYAQVVGDLTAAVSAVTAEILNSPLWASLCSFTEEPDVEYRMGTSNGFGTFTEYGSPDAARATTDGHMLPIQAHDRGMGWTWDYLRKARMSQLEADIADAVQDVRDIWRKKMLTRLLKRGDDSGASIGLGSAGLSPGFATTAASTGVDFTPPAWGGNTFTSTHEHYVPIAGGAFTTAVFTDIKDELREHGHEMPYDCIIGPSDEAAVRALSGFVPVPSNVVAYGANVSVAQLDPAITEPGVYYIGTINDINVRVVSGMPQYYGFAWKSYGRLSQRNPLRVRLQKGEQAWRVVAMTDPRAGNATLPIQNLMLFTEFGVGVGDRTNGTPRYVNNAAWADGTAG